MASPAIGNSSRRKPPERIGGLEGSAVYNHIALRVSSLYGNTAFFEENDVKWRKLQWSFADRESCTAPASRR